MIDDALPLSTAVAKEILAYKQKTGSMPKAWFVGEDRFEQIKEEFWGMSPNGMPISILGVIIEAK